MERKGKKIKEAAVLKYNPDEDTAPTIVALGKGVAAESIIETAKHHELMVYKDEQLAHALNALNIGDEIPPELYEVVAEILVFIGNIDRSFGDKYAIK